ncbi:paraquat-inducible protein A [Pseudahrensia aquimaris]|uniref:Paraquat-inducible protein A n=1 Tax=Pseudahrensia aquimaris TaxID=744461 RepID=A0ABW3FA15_9HYPH
MRTLIALLLLFAAIGFGIGISLPIVRFERLFFFEDTPSLIDLVIGLSAQGSWLIALAVLLFSIIFPIVKLSITYLTAFAPEAFTETTHTSLARWAPALAKWSMMDVLLVALVIFAAKTSGLATAFTQPGLWFYAASSICGAVAANLLKRQETKIAD